MEKINATRSVICTSAHDWIDTPYQHQARVKGVGVDCAMLICGIAEENGLVTQQELKDKVPAYTREWQLHNKEEKMIDILTSFGCVEIHQDDMQPGDIITFKFGRVASHLGILVNDNYIIHAMWNTGKVAKTGLSGNWVKRIHSVYKLPGVK